MTAQNGFLASDTFLRAYTRRQRDARLLAAIDRCLERLQADPNHPGLKTKQLFTSRGVDVMSARVNDYWRVIFALPPSGDVVLVYIDGHDESLEWKDRARARIGRLVERASAWTGRAALEAPASVPRLDSDTPIPVGSVDALREMLVGGMHRYLASLDDLQRSYARTDFTQRAGLMFIRGGAGTGKTAIAIHRALYLAQQAEIGRGGVRYLCYNRTLAKTVTETLVALNGGALPDQLRVTTFHEWASSYLRSRGRGVTVERRDTWLPSLVRQIVDRERLEPALGGLTVGQVVDEIRSLIKPVGLETLKDYLSFDRRRRRFPLKQGQRDAIWRIFEEVRYANSGRAEYVDLPALALEELKTDQEFLPLRAVVVDEGQDCSPVMARLAREMVRGDHRRLTVLADSAQSIYPNGFAWARREFAPRGAQNIVLRVPYRSTRQIHALASSLYADVPEVERELRDLRDSPREGPRPSIHVAQSVDDAERFLVESVKEDLRGDGGRRPEEIAVLSTTNAGRDRAWQLLEAEGLPCAIIQREQVDLDAPSIKIMTVHTSKGLDFPTVYLHRFQQREAEPSSEERALLYVALTRSSFKLTVVCDRDAIAELLRDLNPETYELTGPASGLLAS